MVSATFILDDEGDFAGMNEGWGRRFPTDQPARQGAKLPIRPGGMKISMGVVAEAWQPRNDDSRADDDGRARLRKTPGSRLFCGAGASCSSSRRRKDRHVSDR